MGLPQPGIIDATSYQLHQLTLISSCGRAVDITGIWKELSVYEDIFTNTLSGSVVLNDSRNLINELPIIGSEFLLLSFEKPTQDLVFTRTFRVYKLSDRTHETNTNETYILHFASEELILNEQVLVSKAYQSRTISTMVDDICRNVLKIPDSKLQRDAIQATDSTTSLIIPNWSPFYAINWLSTIALSGDVLSASFVFFENRLGYYFRAIETMFRGEPVLTVHVAPRNLGSLRSPDAHTKQLQGVMQWEMPHGWDELQAISLGAYAGSLTIVDLNSQSQRTMSLRADQQFQSTNHGNAFTSLQALPNRFDKTPQDMSDSLYRVMPQSSEVQRWMLQRNMYMGTLHGHRVKVALPGNLALTAGALVQCNFPAATGHHDAEKLLDETYSGVYLITSVHHKLDRQKHVCICELMKESRSTVLPSADRQVRLVGA